MVNHPSRRPRYKVWPVPGSSDTNAETHFAVKGPDVEYFARMGELAKVMQTALNRDPDRDLTASELSAVRTAIGFALAGEFYGSRAEQKALESAQRKL